MPVTVSRHLAMFGCHWYSGSGDIKYLMCQVTSQNHIIEGSREFMREISLSHATTFPNSVAKCIAVVEIYCFKFVTR